MPTLTPTPTILTPAAPVRTIAHSLRSERTAGAIEQESTPFGEALQSAQGAPEPATAESEADPATSDQPDADTDAEATDAAIEPDDAPEQPADESADSIAAPEDAETEPAVNPDLEAQIQRELDLGAVAIEPARASAMPTVEQPNPNGSAPAPTIARPGAAAQTAPLSAATQTEQSQPLTALPVEQGQVAAGQPVLPQPADEPNPQATPEALPAPATTIAAPQPSNQPVQDPAAPTNPTPIDGQAAAAVAIDDQSAATSDEQQQQQQQPNQFARSQQASPQPAESAPPLASADPAAAQPLRPAVAEAAPVQVDPAAIEAPAPQTNSAIGPRQNQGVSPTSSPTLGRVETEQAFNASVHRGLAAAVRQQGGTLTIKLDPPTLGKLTIKMTIDQGKVQATFDAQNAQARDLLMDHSTALRASLRDKGLTVERLEILGATSAGAGRASQGSGNTGEQQGAGQGSGDERHDAAGDQSRGRSETGEEQPSTGDGVMGDTAGTAGEPTTSAFEAQLRYSVSAVA